MDTPSAAGQTVLTVLMPCLNEQKTVAGCVAEALKGLAATGVNGEVLVVDNGSTDESVKKATEAGARVVTERQRGYGAALRCGIQNARGTYIVMGDADGSYDFLRIKDFLPVLDAGADLVMGNRFKGGIEKGAMPALHHFGNPVLTAALNLLFGTHVGDAHCGMRAFRTASAKSWDLRTLGMEFASEIVVKAQLHKAKISEIPFPLRRDGRGHASHLRSFHDGWRHLRYLLLMSPSWLTALPAAILIVIGVPILTWLTFGQQHIGPVKFDANMMIFGAMCVTLGWQLLILWLCAKIFGWQTRIVPIGAFARKHLHLVNLERGLILGTLLFLAGFSVGLYLLWYWSTQNFGELDVQVTLRYAIWSMVLTFLGVQTVASSFFLGFLVFHLSPHDDLELSAD